MNYNEFVDSVTGYLREAMPTGTRLEMIPLEKNNGVIREGLSVRRKGRNVAPTIYLDAYYQEYLEGRNLGGIYEQILEYCGDSDFEDRFEPEFFADYGKLRPTIVYKLINREKNEALLEKIPYLPYMDLAIVFYCLLADTPAGSATVLIHNTHLQLWKTGISDIYAAARENAPTLLPARLESMGDVIRELSGGTMDTCEDETPMYVLTNTAKVFGAACILYEGMMDVCRMRIGADFYVLPSSIHEVILLPVGAVPDKGELGRIVREINATQVRDTEVLSDNVYYYSAEEGRLTPA